MSDTVLKWLQLSPALETCAEISRTPRWTGPGGERDVFPPRHLTFKAFDYFAPTETRVVVLGQDPYHHEGKASGRAFGYHHDYKGPVNSSLLHVLQEVQAAGSPLLTDASLEPWARQGVLLLNTRLSVRRESPMSHAGLGWESAVLTLLTKLNTLCPRIVWLAWGREARLMVDRANVSPERRINTSHPCKYSNTRLPTPFTGSLCFDWANILLHDMGKEPIKW